MNIYSCHNCIEYIEISTVRFNRDKPKRIKHYESVLIYGQLIIIHSLKYQSSKTKKKMFENTVIYVYHLHVRLKKNMINAAAQK